MARMESRSDSAHVTRYRPSGESTSSSLGEILERVLDKGIVITGDIKIFLTDVELLTIQIRLVITSVERAEEMGLDWWKTNPAFSSQAGKQIPAGAEQRETPREREEEPRPSSV